MHGSNWPIININLLDVKKMGFKVGVELPTPEEDPSRLPTEQKVQAKHQLDGKEKGMKEKRFRGIQLGGLRAPLLNFKKETFVVLEIIELGVWMMTSDQSNQRK